MVEGASTHGARASSLQAWRLVAIDFQALGRLQTNKGKLGLDDRLNELKALENRIVDAPQYRLGLLDKGGLRRQVSALKNELRVLAKRKKQKRMRKKRPQKQAVKESQESKGADAAGQGIIEDSLAFVPCEYTGGRFIHVSPFEPRAGETGRVFIFSDKAFQAPSDFGFKPTQNHIHGGYGKPIRWRSVGGVAAGGFGFVGEYTFGEPGTYRMKKGQTEAQLSCPELIVLKARRRSRQSVSASNEKQAQASRLRQTQPNVVPETATPSPRPNPNEQKPVLEPQPSEVANGC